jgi:predicted secreted protein
LLHEQLEKFGSLVKPIGGVFQARESRVEVSKSMVDVRDFAEKNGAWRTRLGSIQKDGVAFQASSESTL